MCLRWGSAQSETKLFAVTPNICALSVWDLLLVTLLAPKILMWLVNFVKVCVPLV